MAPDLLDIRAAAALTGRHPETVRRWVWTGKLRAQRRGRRLLVHRAEVEALGRARQADTTLAAWRDRARAHRAETPASAQARSAADLVLGDRVERSGETRAGR